jgi:chromate transporter
VNGRLDELVMVFAMASILSFGGANTIVPQLQLATVHEHGWLTAAQFADCFAIAQVAPGPNTMIATLIGYQAAGLVGALLATVAMAVPSCVLAFGVTKLWLQSGHARWHVALEHGLAPIGVGLVAAAGVIVARAVDHGALAWGVTIAAAAVLAATRLNPLLVVAAGGLAGLALGGL